MDNIIEKIEWLKKSSFDLVEVYSRVNEIHTFNLKKGQMLQNFRSLLEENAVRVFHKGKVGKAGTGAIYTVKEWDELYKKASLDLQEGKYSYNPDFVVNQAPKKCKEPENEKVMIEQLKQMWFMIKKRNMIPLICQGKINKKKRWLLTSQGHQLMDSNYYYEYNIAVGSKNTSLGDDYFSNRLLTLEELEFYIDRLCQESRMFNTTSQLKSGSYLTLIKNSVVIDILSAFFPVFLNTFFEKDKSFLKKFIGKRIGNKNLNVFITPTGLKHYSFDDEGVKTKEFYLIKDGIFNGPICTMDEAIRLGLEPMGCGWRQKDVACIEPGITNLRMKFNLRSKSSLLNEIDSGLYLVALRGLRQGKNILIGDLSGIGTVIIVKNRKLISGVKGVTVNINLIKLFNDMIYFGDDWRWKMTPYGAMLAPSIIVQDVLIKV
ncbi:hypothetical protein BBF96_10105 [Anoxybacter fermentans]|uniref:Metalloprotease TldD/E C-terminal domain-containing protein n=1 Tax=Anoxybacter fermentans TaxID=1323375 RepID=A0A3S9SZI2_9FIRM|nr:metallopeptidase TldD-related protein [Anoxybacter fermentans]AZR73704.1 hypothetical protein BBF96_10105 [Anoxybacter fermentans]